MENGQPKSQLRPTRRQSGSKSRKGKLNSQELIQYLSTPLTLPSFDIVNTTYKQAVINTIQDLLQDAIETGILPEKVIGVQFIFARRFISHSKSNDDRIQTDFTFPFLICSKSSEQALALADGLAFVTKFLMEHESSFHFRVRKNKLTYSPVVCIYTTSPAPDEITFDESNSTTVLWVDLPVSTTREVNISFPNKSLVRKKRCNDRSINWMPRATNRFFYEADLNTPIKLGLYDADKDPSFDINPSQFRVEPIRESYKTIDEKRGWLGTLQNELHYDIPYLRRVSYLLRFGDIILCTPHAYDDVRSVTPDNIISPHDMITDAGLTVMIDRNLEKITEDDWLRIQVVAQKLAIFAGAAVSTASEARVSILNTLHDGFAHEFGNAALSIINRIKQLEDGGMPLTSSDREDIQGRLQFTQRYIDSAIKMYKAENVSLGKTLEELVAPLMKYKDLEVKADYEIPYDHKVMNLWNSVLIEVIRNAYKYGAIIEPGNKKEIIITAESNDKTAVVVVSNVITAEDKKSYKLSNYPKGWDLIQELSKFLKGSVTPQLNEQHLSIVIKMPLSTTATGALNV